MLRLLLLLSAAIAASPASWTTASPLGRRGAPKAVRTGAPSPASPGPAAPRRWGDAGVAEVAQAAVLAVRAAAGPLPWRHGKGATPQRANRACPAPLVHRSPLVARGAARCTA